MNFSVELHELITRVNIGVRSEFDSHMLGLTFVSRISIPDYEFAVL